MDIPRAALPTLYLMIRLAKRLSILSLALLILGGGTVYFGTQAILEAYRPQLLAEISDAVGCPVSYRRATLKLTPALEVVLHDVEVMGTPFGFEVTTPYLAAEVKMGALLDRHLDFHELTLRSPSIVLITGNPASPSQPPPSLSPPTGSTPPTQTTQSLPLAGIETISISSGRITKRSSAGKETLMLEDLSIQSGLLTQGSTITVRPSRTSFTIPIDATNTKRFPFQGSLQNLTYTTTPRALSIQSAELISGNSVLNVSGAMDLTVGTVTASVQGTKVGLLALQPILGASELAGAVDIQATVSLSEQATQITGTVGVSSAKITLRTGESYGVSSLSGPFSIQRTVGQGVSIQGKSFTVQGFSYQDPNVSLKNVNGALSNVVGTIGEDGATVFSVAVHGTALDLTSGPFSIKKITSVDSPITIKVPATPGYSITGPVKASGVEMTFHGRPITGASGSVDMLISHSLLRFGSQGIQAQSNSVPVSMSGTVEINDSTYSVKNLVGQLAGGSLASTITIQRSPKEQVDAEVLAKELDVAVMKSLLTGDPQPSFSGRIDHISVKATGRKGDLLSSSTGVGVIEITDGSVARAKFDRRVVGLIKAIPVVGEAVSFTSSATDTSTYEMRGGMLKDLTADFTIGNGLVSSKNIKAQGKFSNLVASGSVSLGGNLNLTASAVYLEQNLRAIAGPITPLGNLFGTIGKIEIPLLITGSVGDPQISADLSRLQDISMPGRAISPILRGLESIVGSSSDN